MTAAAGLTALVLAGTRPGGDPLADYAGVSHKALIEIGGVPMLARVLAALDAAPRVGAHRRGDRSAGGHGVRCRYSASPLTVMAPQSGPSASVAAALARLGTPLLVTTADHALLRPEWIDEFLRRRSWRRLGADALLALARREAVLVAAPDTQRTWLRFSDGAYSGCNLFLLRNAGGARRRAAVAADGGRRASGRCRCCAGWGLRYVLRYRLGWLSLAAALARLGTLCGRAPHGR